MGDLFRRSSVIFGAALLAASVVQTSLAQAQSEPPARVGRLAFTQGTVSYHPHDQDGWVPAVVNTPLTSGDAVWTEPNAHSEISLGGSRIRLQDATQLDMLALDDSQTRLQLDQGRIDVKSVAMDAKQPYEFLTPRGTGALLRAGDYYLEAGSAQDATRLGVRAGAAQFRALNGQVLDVRPGEVAEATGDPNNPQLRVINTAPPAQPAYWATRDRQVVYDQPPQYLTAGITGYEDLNAYGSWTNDPGYGQVWMPRAVPAGWAPYRTGHWAYQPPWGWTWVDDQPWGFAPYHYGRWANSGGRWFWVPPERDVRPVYAPALVAFVGGTELALTLGNRSVAPVGWFPLGPREVYVPSYTTNQDYYYQLNRSARVQDEILRQRWERAQQREAFEAGQRSVLMNQRFATVVPATAFVNSQPVTQAALRVPQERLIAAPVAPVSAPPAPTASIAQATSATKAPPAAAAPAAAAPAAAAPVANLAVAKTAVADMPALAKPVTAARPASAPGPQIATTQPKLDNNAKLALPPLAPRQGAAPPPLAPQQQATPVEPAKPQATPTAPPLPQQAKPGEPPKPQTAPAPAPQQQAKPVEPPKTQATPGAPPPLPQQARPVEPTKPQAAPAPAPQQQAKPGEPPKPQAAPPPPPQQARPVEAPRPQPQAAPPPQAHPAPAPPQPQGHAAPPPQAAPQPQQVAPPPQARPAPAPQPQQQGHAAPPPQAAPQPQQAAPQQARPAPPSPPQQQHPVPQQAQNPPQQQQPQPAPQPQQQQQQQKKPDEKK